MWHYAEFGDVVLFLERAIGKFVGAAGSANSFCCFIFVLFCFAGCLVALLNQDHFEAFFIFIFVFTRSHIFFLTPSAQPYRNYLFNKQICRMCLKLQ